ncbi:MULTISPECIES: hypothetical protein [spotted fever group]|uniref:Uncharacterized protein n=1 Tax=Rickettsia tamurae subsp. buchneri TaxID=1462938 RepID=A0A8E0WLF6_9RICK|nr:MULTISPECIES: hypothetical protein [spotted fever group]KDO02724.1 hypothetical protein REISMN_05520 [Rickettsia tamurae subsp. buchneri]
MLKTYIEYLLSLVNTSIPTSFNPEFGLRVYVDRLQSLKNKYEKAKDSSQAVSKIILDYIENQESDGLKAKLVITCQNLGLIEDYSEVAQENAVYKCLDEAFDLLDQGLKNPQL